MGQIQVIIKVTRLHISCFKSLRIEFGIDQSIYVQNQPCMFRISVKISINICTFLLYIYTWNLEETFNHTYILSQSIKN